MGKKSKVSLIIKSVEPDFSTWNGILDEVIGYKSDFIIFQNSSKEFLKNLRKREDYAKIYNIDGDNTQLILEKETSSASKSISLTSYNKAALFGLKNEDNYKKELFIGTFKLDDDSVGRMCMDRRQLQLWEIGEALKNYETHPMIIAGDFSFKRDMEHVQFLPKYLPNMINVRKRFHDDIKILYYGMMWQDVKKINNGMYMKLYF